MGILAYRRLRAAINGVIVAVTVLTAAAPHAWALTIVAFGDSLTAGYGLADPATFFPARLERALRARGVDARVVNAGVSGDTTSGGLARLDWSVGDKPDLVILELGANDALRGIQPAVTAANLDAMLTRLKARGVPVLLAGMLAPPNLGAEYGRAFRTLYSDLAARHGVPLYPFFLDGVAAQPALLQRDGMHPTQDGIDVIVGRILPYVLWALNAGPKPPSP